LHLLVYLLKLHSVTKKEAVVVQVVYKKYYLRRNINSVKIVTTRMIQKFLCTSKNKGTFFLVDLLIMAYKLLVLEASGFVLRLSGSGYSLVRATLKTR
jgi:hypothetical protein